MLRVLNEERGEELQVTDRYPNIEDESIPYQSNKEGNLACIVNSVRLKHYQLPLTLGSAIFGRKGKLT